MKDDDDEADKKKIRRNGRCSTRKIRHIILGAVCNKTVCPICSKLMSAPHEVSCSTVMKLYV